MGLKSSAFMRKRSVKREDDQTVILMENVSKSYSTGAPALNNINLHINKGEFV